MKIAVVTPKMYGGEKGGAENLYSGLVNALNEKGHEITQIEVVVDESSFDGILRSYCDCFYMDLSHYDLVISTKAPTYMVRHPNHISYLLHTIRVFYDRFENEFKKGDKERQKQRKLIHEFDKYGLDPSRIKKHCVIGETVAGRLKDADTFWKKIDFEVIPPATKIADFKNPSNGEYLFLPGRLHRWKRVDLVIRSMKFIKKNVKLLIAGTGEQEKTLRDLAKGDERIEFLGSVSDEQLVDLYSKSIVVPFVPVNEDYGYVTIEAFKSKKPVITCRDSGEPALIVKDGMSGFIVEPKPEKIAEKINYLLDNPDKANRMGENGYTSVKEITWENVVSKLLEDVKIQPEKSIKPLINVAIIDMQPIDPAIGGGRLRLKGLYSNLGNNLKSVYIGTFDWKGEKSRKIQISKSLIEFDIPLDDEHFKLNEHFNKLLPEKTIIDVIFPLLAEASPKYVETVRQETKNSDVIVLSHPWLYPVIKTEVNLKNKILVYDSQNFEAALREQILGKTPFAVCLSQMVKFVERELCEDCDLIISSSDIDRKQFKEKYGIDPHKIETFPNGVDVNDIKLIDIETRKKSKAKLKITQKAAIFIGSDYPPNVEAGNFIIDKLSDECLDVFFMIVGSVGVKLNSKNKKNVKIYGMVSDEDKKMLISASDIAINPMLNGSGTNIKMFEYLAAGLPTISSFVGARGINNEDAFIVTDLKNFPDEIKKLFSDDNLYGKLSANGRKLVERYYDWNEISSKLGNRIYDLYFSQSPLFSVIIPMYRGDYIEKIIGKLNQQTYRDFEVIIVDSGKERREAIRSLCNFRLKYIFKSDIGAARARNVGIQNASGKIVAFTDDDCQPDPDWLENAGKYFEDYAIAGLEGSIYTDEDKINDPKYRIVSNKGIEGIGFMTANLFIRLNILKMIEGFDVRFDKPHFREDTDLAWRAQKHGKIPFGKDVRVFHPAIPRKIEGESREERDRFFVNDALLFQKHPEKYIDLMKLESHYKSNNNFWKFFLEGTKSSDLKLPIEIMLNDQEINKFIPEKLKRNYGN